MISRHHGLLAESCSVNGIFCSTISLGKGENSQGPNLIMVVEWKWQHSKAWFLVHHLIKTEVSKARHAITHVHSSRFCECRRIISRHFDREQLFIHQNTDNNHLFAASAAPIPRQNLWRTLTVYPGVSGCESCKFEVKSSWIKSGIPRNIREGGRCSRCFFFFILCA